MTMGHYMKGTVLAVAGTALASSLAVGAAFAPTTMAAFTDTTVASANTATAGTVQVDVVDTAGAVTSDPRITITNAAPDMSTRQYTMKLKNNGSLAASLRVQAANLVPTGENLDDVLQVQVLDQLNNTVYTGKLSALDFTNESLAASSNIIYTFRVTWPDTAADDNPYQGAALTFDLTSDASSIAGQ